MSEKELKELARNNDVAPPRAKRRRLRDLNVQEQAHIIHAVQHDFQQHKDVAAQYKIHPTLVGRLIKKNKADPFFLSKHLRKEQEKKAQTEATVHVVSKLLQRGAPIESSKKVQDEILTTFNLEVQGSMIRTTMKKQLHMSFRTVKKIPKQGNTERCLVLRQQYALKLLPLLEAGRRVINVDESWLRDTTFFRKLWAPKADACSVPMSTVAPRLSVIAAIDTEGHAWFSLT